MRAPLSCLAIVVLCGPAVLAQTVSSPCDEGRFVEVSGPVLEGEPATSLGLAGLEPPTAAAQRAWEPIAPDYSNVRGLNYIPHWAGSSVGTWRYYDAAQVERDLGYFAGIGCNSVRIWMSEIVYREEGDLFLAKFRDFLRRCEAHRLYVMPVIWDAVGGQPSATPYDDTSDWVKNPASADALDPAFWAEHGDPYVEALVCAARGSPAVLMWDLMNEPGPLPFLQHQARLVDALAPSTALTIGWAAAHANSLTAAWPEIDVLSYHPYGCFEQNIRLWTERAREISLAHGGKPILASEFGSPGLMQRYEDALQHITEEGVGFLLFQAMIGPPPHFLWWQDGFFYQDGEVRDVAGVQAFQEVSILQGYGGVLLPIVEKPASDPLFLPMSIVPLGFGGPELVTSLDTWLDRPPLEADFVPILSTISTWASISIAWLEILEPGDVAAIQDVIDGFNDAVAAEDYVQADVWLDYWGFFNWWYVNLLGLKG